MTNASPPPGIPPAPGSPDAHLTGETLNDLLDSRLTPEARARAESHLAGCAQCRAEHEALGHVIALGHHARSLSQAPPELWLTVAATTIHERLIRRHVLRSIRGPLALIGAALVLASLLLGAMLASRIGSVWEAGQRAGHVAPVEKVEPPDDRLQRRLEETEERRRRTDSLHDEVGRRAKEPPSR
jgi:anti-sigma factor RsiW